MTQSRSVTKLYTPRLLALCAELSAYPLTDDLALRAEARSRTCGSSIEVGFGLKEDATVAAVGMVVSACAIGQSSAAIMAASGKGRQIAEFAAVLEEIQGWLDGQGPLPEWPGFDALETARDAKGRHGALLLPWQAAVQALSTAPLSSGAGTR